MGSIFRKKSSPRLHWRDSYNHGNRHLQLPLPQSLTVWSSGVRENTAVGTWILLVAGTTWLCKVVPAAVWTLCCSKVSLALPAHQAPNDQHYHLQGPGSTSYGFYSVWVIFRWQSMLLFSPMHSQSLRSQCNRLPAHQHRGQNPGMWLLPCLCMVFIITFTQTKEVALQLKWCGDCAAPVALRNQEFPQLFWRKWVMIPHSLWSAMHSSFWQGATLALCIPCDAPYLYRVLCLLPIMFGIDPKLDHFIHLFLIMSERTNQAPLVNGFPYTRTVCPVLTSNLRTSFKKRLVSANSSLTAPNQHPYWWESLDS